jgi:nucleoside-diphosphate-sugar epimerase
MKTIAITGSSGFVGHHLLKSLNKEDFHIIELDITNGFNVSNWEDINKISSLDIIIHLAAKSFVPESFVNPHYYYENNYKTTLNVLELARINKAKVIYFSSYVYGDPVYLPIDEKHPVHAHNPYAQTKIICEKLCEGYNRDFNVPIIIFRPFNIYGEGQNSNFLIPSIIEQIKKGIVNLKDPRPRRDFIYIDDVVLAIEKAIGKETFDYEILNLGSGISHSVSELIKILKDLSKYPFEEFYSGEIRKGEVLNTVADMTRCHSFLEWENNYSLIMGLKKTLEHS